MIMCLIQFNCTNSTNYFNLKLKDTPIVEKVADAPLIFSPQRKKSVHFRSIPVEKKLTKNDLIPHHNPTLNVAYANFCFILRMFQESTEIDRFSQLG
jgi:hypothetical protein